MLHNFVVEVIRRLLVARRLLLRDPAALNVEASTWRLRLHALGHGASELLVFVKDLLHVRVTIRIDWPLVDCALGILFLLVLVVSLVVKVGWLGHEGAWTTDQLVGELLVSSAHRGLDRTIRLVLHELSIIHVQFLLEHFCDESLVLV